MYIKLCFSLPVMTAALAVLSRFPLLSKPTCCIYCRLMFSPLNTTYAKPLLSFLFFLKPITVLETMYNRLLGRRETHYMATL